MSVQAMSWVFEHSEARLAARLVLLAIANHADADGRNAWASVRRLAEEAHVSERQARYGLRQLEAAGEIVDVGMSERGTHTYELPALAGALFAPAESAPGRIGTSGGQNPTAAGARIAPKPPKPQPPEPSPSSSEPRALDVPRPDVDGLCDLLAGLIEANGIKRPTITAKWRSAARLLLDRDGYPAEQVAAVIAWCQADDFWRSNVLSMGKLREQYARLLLRMRQGPAGRDRATEIHEWAEQLREAGQ